MRDQLDGRPLFLVSDTDELQTFSNAEKGIFHIDPRPFMAKATGPVRFPMDGHLNDEGHKRTAQALREGLRAFFDAKGGNN